MYVHTNTHTCTHKHAHSLTHTHRLFMHVSSIQYCTHHMCANAEIDPHIRLYSYVYMYIHMYIYIHTYIPRICMYICIYMCTYKHIFIHTYIPRMYSIHSSSTRLTKVSNPFNLPSTAHQQQNQNVASSVLQMHSYTHVRRFARTHTYYTKYYTNLHVDTLSLTPLHRLRFTVRKHTHTSHNPPHPSPTAASRVCKSS